MMSFHCDNCKDVYIFQKNNALIERHTGEVLGAELPADWWLGDPTVAGTADYFSLYCGRCKKVLVE